MKYLILISILLIAVGAQLYTSYRLWHILPNYNIVKFPVIFLYSFSFICIFLYGSMALNNGKLINFTISKWIYEIGCSHIFILLYFFLLLVVLEIGKATHILPTNFFHNNLIGSVCMIGFLLCIFIAGNLNYQHKDCKTFHIQSPVSLPNDLKIICISDLHLGYHIQKKEFVKWVEIINQENPDLILIGGDIIDFSSTPLKEQKMEEVFRQLKAPIYACLGNHDYMAGIDETKEFCKKATIHLLQDSCIHLDNLGLNIIGRDDRTNPNRLALNVLASSLSNDSSYTIVLDHQPYHLEESEKNNIHFQFSGHTHYGQVWPITYIIDALYEDGYGFLQKGNTSYYVTSGIGIWGGKFRIGTTSEYIVLHLHNKN